MSIARNYLLAALAGLLLATAAIAQVSTDPDAELVGRAGDGRTVTPVNQVLTPIGKQVDLPGLRPQAVALSPDGRLLVASGKTSELIVLDPATGDIRQRVALPSEQQQLPASEVVSDQILHPDDEGQLSFTGLIFSPDGKRIYMSNVDGSIKVFAVDAEAKVAPSHTFALPPANVPRRDAEIPSGLAVTPDGKLLYVCGNLSNRLLELDTATGGVKRSFEVGVAPYDVVLVDRKAYVSNWGGRRPDKGDLTGPAGRGTVVRVDERRIASEGSVSVIDLEAGKATAELVTGLHASGLAASPDGRYVVCANAASDNLCVVDAERDEVIETLWAKPNASELLGAAPNALAFDRAGRRLYAANGSQNAVAVFSFEPEDRGESKLSGLIPVGWYPGAIVIDHQRSAFITANIKGLPKQSEQANDSQGQGFNSHQYTGSLTIAPIPPDAELPALSEQVSLNFRQPIIAEALLPPRQGQPPRAIPARIGEPSLIKHVVYIIKENRTYDQVFGDIPRGNGDPSLCVFGERITPNHHKIASDFVLLDNAYCCGILSADGHQWSTTAYSTDYMEKAFAGFARSYPDGFGEDENDALAYSPGGFIWDNALKRKKTLRNFGEFMSPGSPHIRWTDANRRGKPRPIDHYRAWKDKTGAIAYHYIPSVETLEPYSPKDFAGWEMAVPDQVRADHFLNDLAESEKRGEYPNLTILCLFNDHTAGTSEGYPTPRACVADNDLAFGRVIEGLSRSKFWKEMAVFAIEDDPQAGWDHVSGYRTISFVASPYAKRSAVVSTQYNTTSILRTIEQILGLPPMNQFDASATPMFDCFTDKPDFTPYKSVENNVPLDELNPSPDEIGDAALREDALVSAKINFRQLDRAPEDVLNRILWRAMRGSADPYPEWAIGAEEDEEEEEEAFE
jgi:DNA-binding beta-propeller fold protein YncE